MAAVIMAVEVTTVVGDIMAVAVIVVVVITVIGITMEEEGIMDGTATTGTALTIMVDGGGEQPVYF